MTSVILKPHKEESLLRRHPWVFSGAIARVVLDSDDPNSQPQEGDLVQVRSSVDALLGIGHWQVGSIAVRILAFGIDELPADFWHQRILAAYKVRETLGLTPNDQSPDGVPVKRGNPRRKGHQLPITKNEVNRALAAENHQFNNTYRLIHGEGDFLPGLIVDIYADTAVMQAHSVGMHRCRQSIAEAIIDSVPEVHNVYYKSEDTLPFKAPVEGEKVGWLITNDQSPITNSDEFWSVENGLSFRIDWLRGQKTGFFIDQRENRALVERYARGKDVLNMFCYTGGFSLYALRGGAKSVDSVDVSQKAIDLVEANVAKNFPDDPRHHAYAADAFDFLSEKITNHKSQITNYDLIILDPPAFAKHRDAVKNALRGYQRINAKAIQMIRPGGILFTFSCSQAVDKEAFRLAVFSAAAQVGRNVRILHQLHQPQDHPINIYHPEGEYLKGLVLYVE